MNLLTIKEAAKILKVSEKTLRRWEAKNYISPIRTSGKHRRYSLDQLKEVKKNKNKTVNTNTFEVKDLVFKPLVNEKTVDIDEIILPKVKAPVSKVSKFFVAYIAMAIVTTSGYTFARIKSTTVNDIKEIQPTTQAVLAATSFQNAEFAINIPTILNSSLTLGTDTITDFTGTGLSVVNGALTAEASPLGEDITSSEIVDGTISEVDLLSSNTPSGAQYLSFNSTTGGFTWSTPTDNVGSNFFTDSGSSVYLTETSDEFVLGGTSPLSSSKLSIDGDSDQIQFLVQAASGQTNDILVVEKSDGTNIFTIDNNSLAKWTKSGSGQWISFDDGTDQWGLYNYAGSPEGNITSNTGTLAMDTQNGTLYVKTDDGDATGWVNLATGATSPWTETGGLITLVSTTNNVNLGGSTDLGKLAVDGDSDEVQFLVQGNGTQTSDLVVFENSAGVNLLTLTNSGALTLGSNGTDGTLSLYNELGATDYSVNFQTSSSQTGNITYTLPVDDGGGSNYVLSTDGTGILSWQSVLGIGGMSSFTLSGDSGTDQTVSDSNILEIAGGVNGIDSVTSATDTITLNIDTTEIGETTFGNNTDNSIVWTFDQSGTTDPTITFGDGLVTVGGDLAITGGNITTAVTADSTLTVTGTTTTNGTLTANGVVTLGDGGDTVTINSSDWDISAVGDLTGIGNITIDGRFDTAAHANNTGLNLPTYAGSPVAVTGTAEGDIVYNTVSDTLYIYDGGSFTAIGGGGYSGWTIDGDDLDTEAISSGNTLLLAGGTNGIDTDVSATDTITLNFDATEVGSVTFGSGSAITWTFDASAGTDTTVAFGNDSINLTAGTITLTGNTDATNGVDVTGSNLTVGGANFSVAVSSGDVTTAGTITGNVNETINGIDISSGTVSDVVNLTINTGGDLTIGAIGLNDVGSTNITSGASLVGVYDEFTNSNSTTVQDVLDDLDGAIGAGASKFTQDTGFVYLTTTTDSVTIGGNTELGKLAVDGNADEVQLLVQGNGTQTANLVVFENSSGTDQLTLTNTGDLTIAGDLAISGGNITTAVTFDSAVNFTPSGTNDITFNVDTDSLLTLDSSVTNGDNFVISPNNAGTGTSFTGTLTSSNLTADRTWTLQDGDGTVAFLTDIPTSDNYQYFTIDGDDATTEQIGSTNTLLVAGGTNGIDTDVSATDTITLNFDTTEVGDSTFGSGSAITWTFDASAGTDPTITFGSDLVTVGNGLTVTGTTTTNGTLTANGLVTLGDNGDTVAINSSDWDIDTTGAITGVSLDANGSGNSISNIDFDNILASPAVDEATDINLGANQLSIDLDSTGDFVIRDVTTAFVTFNETNLGQVVLADGAFLDLGAVLHNDATVQGLRLPQNTALTNMGTEEGFLAWDTDDNTLYAYNGSTWQNVGGASTTLQQAYDNDADGSDTLITLNATDGSLVVKPVAGTNFQVAQVTSAPTVDIMAVTNTGLGTTTTGVDGISLTFVTGDGTNPTNNGINLALTSGGTAAGDVLNGINFGLTGTSGTERGVNFSDNNFDTDINATTDLTIGIDGTNEVTLTGTNLTATTAEGNSLGSATLEWEQLFVGDDNGIAFGLDQDWTLGYDETTDDRLELITAGTSGMLIQTANATGSSLNLTTNSLTTGTGLLIDNSANTLTTGTILQAQSTGTSLTTAADAFLGYFDWTPASTTNASGDLFRINIGSNGNVTNVFNVTDGGSSLFRVSETQIESLVPHNFSAAGDVNIAYDLVFTNQTASVIDSYGPLTLRAGESFESNNLTLTSYLSGNILLNTGATAGKVGIGAGITPLGLLTVDSTGTAAIGKAALTVIQDESQDIITASASATTRFTVNSAGNTFVTLRNTATSAVCHVTNGAGYDELTDCLTSVAADYAERYPVATGITYGDIVMTGSENITTTDGQVIKKLVKSNAPYQNNVIGITSDNWGDFTSAGDNVKPEDNPMPVALSGRVPVKVADSSDEIHSGDLITSSSEEGKAMKATTAGKVIGVALEDWLPNTGKETVMVYVSNFYYSPAPENAVSREEIEELLQITEQNQQLLEESLNWNSNTASESGEFTDIITNNLFVTGIAAIDSLSISDSLTINNNLVIGDGNIDSLTTPLNIEGSGAQPLNFMAGKVSIDTNGNMIIQGDLKVLGTLDTEKLNVSQNVAGTSSIIAGTNEITLLNENIKTGGLIFVTPTSPTKNNIYVKSQIDGQAIIGFDPILVNEIEVPTTIDINFNWWIVGVTN